MALKPGISGIVGLQNQSSAEFVGGSLKFNSDYTQYLKATSSFADEDKETLTIAFWLKRHAPTATKATQYVFSTSVQGTIFFDSGNDDQLAFNLRGTTSTNFFTYTLADLRDFSAWTHVVVNINMRSLVQANRFRCFINGVQQVMTNTSYPQNYYHNGNTWYIGAYEGGPSHFPDFSLSNFYCVVGQALGPEYFGFTDPLTNTWRPKKYKNTTIGASPTLENGALIIRAKDASIKGKIISGSAFEDGSGGGNLNFYTSSNGSSWTRTGSGKDATLEAKYLAAGGAGISPKTFIPNDSHERYEYYVWNDNTNFDTGSDHTTNVTGKTFTDSKEANFGANGFHLPFDGNSPIGEDQSGNGNDFTPVKLIGSAGVDQATGALPILEGAGGAVANVGVRTDSNASNLVFAAPLVGNSSDVSHRINGGSTNKVTTDNGDAAGTYVSSNFYGGSYNFDGTGDYVESPYSSDFDFGNGEFTVEAWFNTTQTGNYPGGVNRWQNAKTQCWDLRATTTDKGDRATFVYNDGSVKFLDSGVQVNDGNWHHLAVTRSGNTLMFFVDGFKKVSESYSGTINQGDGTELRIGYNDTTYYNGKIQDVRIYKGVAKYTSNFIPASSNPSILLDSPSGSGAKSQLTKITDGAVAFDGTNDNLLISAHSDLDLSSGDFTVEGFVYPLRSQEQGFVNNWNTLATGQFQVQMSSSGFLQASWAPYSISVYAVTGTTPIRLNAWSHFAYTRSGNTFELFLDGISQGTQTSSNNASANSDFRFGENSDGARDLQGYLSNVRVLKGTALYTSNFIPPTEPLTNITNTKLLACQSPTSATIAAVTPGTITVTNNAAATNFNPFNNDINTVRGQETGYCTWNPNDNISVGLSDGNLRCTDSSVYYRTVFGTHTSVDGKHYFEVTVTALTTTMGVGVYVGNNRNGIDGNNYAYDANTYIVMKNGSIYHDGSTYSYQSSYGAGDTVGVAIDSENRKAWVIVNGILAPGDNPATGTGGMQSISGVGAMPDGELYPVIMVRSVTTEANFGQKPFKFPPPDGFQPLNTANTRLETVTSRPDQFVGVTTYRGNSGTQHINVGMSPDLVWIKERAGSKDHNVYDTVRGVTKELFPNGNGIENTLTSGLTSFNSNGYTFSTADRANGSGRTYVNWFWKAGGPKFGGQGANEFWVDGKNYASAAAAGLDDGDITPSAASVGTKQGFSIIKWTGVDNGSPKTISHGLTNQTPRFVIVKNLTDAENWAVYHASIGPTKYVRLNGNSSYDTSSAYWNNTAPTTTLITLNNSNEVQRVNRDYVLYAWADVPGLQKFGSYRCNGDGSGGGNENGPFVELGFRPALILFRGDYTSDWAWIDEERCKVNYNDVALRANYQYGEIGNARGGDGSSSQPENYAVDLLSNGFKIRASGGSLNSGTNTVTYAAWAKSPFSGLYGGDANAR